MRLDGKVALITGGNSGIGAATALRFAEVGAAVVVAARDTTRAADVVARIEGGGGSAAAFRCDVTEPEECRRVVAATVETFGRLDVLFNNAGVIVRERNVAETTVAEWDHTFAVNTRGTFLMSKFAVPRLAENTDGGCIVNNASVFGLVGGEGVAAYAASKGAVVVLTKAMALDHAAQGIRVNCVCAGSVDTPMLRGEMEEMGGAGSSRPRFEALHPLGRIARPEEVAEAVLFLASDASRFVTGTALAVDGGRSAG